MTRDTTSHNEHERSSEDDSSVSEESRTPITQYQIPMVSPGSIESTASVETIRPTNAAPGTSSPFNRPLEKKVRSNCIAVAPSPAVPRSPLLRRQPSAPTTLQHIPQQPLPPSVSSPRLPPVSESRHGGPPSITSATSSIHPSATRRNPRLRAPLQRLSSYSHAEAPYSSDEDSESAAEADMEVVQAELERSWESQPATSGQTGTVRQRPVRRHSVGTSRGKGSQRGGLRGGLAIDDDLYDPAATVRRQHIPSQQGFYQRDGEDEGTARYTDIDRAPSRLSRHHHDDDTSSEGVPDSEASFTLKDRQDAINITHPFGLKIWKPALYKKSRSVQRTAEGEIHSQPGQWPDRKIRLGNILWTLLFGWWMSIMTTVLAVILLLSTWWSGGAPYAFVLFGLARYLFYPFGRFVELQPDEAYAEEDEGEGRSISEYERYGAVDLERGRQLGIFSHSPAGEHRRGLVGRRRGMSMGSWGEYSERDSLLGADREHTVVEGDEDAGPGRKRRFFGRGQWSLGRIIFFLTFYLIIGPVLLLVCGICWLTVFALPMAKVMSILVSHLRRHPLSMTFHSDLRTAASRRPGTPSAQVLLCTYRAWGWEYYKYTVDGTNIFFVNLIFVVLFTIADEYILAPIFHHSLWITHPALIFTLALLSIIPLAYFIGMAVASISAQSSMGMGAAINAFFGSVVEVFLYSVALTQGKSRLVEGSVIGSIFAGTLLMPGVSMLCGALRRKTQRFNAKSAGVTSTMLLFSVIGAFAPTLFYQIYGTSELRCSACEGGQRGRAEADCQRCYWDQANALTDPFYQTSVKPFSYICSVFLVASYVIGLWFSLRTHAAQIWEMPLHDAAPPTQQQQQQQQQHHQQSLANWRNNIPDEPFLKRIGERMSSRFLRSEQPLSPVTDRTEDHISAPSGNGSAKQRQPSNPDVRIPPLGSSLTPEDSAAFVRNVAEVAAAAATLAVQNSQTPTPTATPRVPQTGVHGSTPKSNAPRMRTSHDWDADLAEVGVSGVNGGGHDAPNWSRMKSSMILLGATILYAIIAEILVDTVDVVLGSVAIDEKFLGFTLFALVPNTTEFLNAISFALNGNIALSMEIGSAYALQVCLLQIPALVAVSAFLNEGKLELKESTFSLIFPRWDLITVILCVFLLAYMYGEGKSNYFKGSILMLAYGVVLMGGFYTPRYPDDVVGIAGMVRTG